MKNFKFDFDAVDFIILIAAAIAALSGYAILSETKILSLSIVSSLLFFFMEIMFLLISYITVIVTKYLLEPQKKFSDLLKETKRD